VNQLDTSGAETWGTQLLDDAQAEPSNAAASTIGRPVFRRVMSRQASKFVADANVTR